MKLAGKVGIILCPIAILAFMGVGLFSDSAVCFNKEVNKEVIRYSKVLASELRYKWLDTN